MKNIEKIADEIIKEAFLKKLDLSIYTPHITDIDYRLIELIDKFKKSIGGIGKIFSIKSSDNLKVPEGEYKILNFIPKKNDVELDIKRQKGFRKKFKLSLKNFLRKNIFINKKEIKYE